MMKDLVLQLTELTVPSGAEHDVQDLLLSHVRQAADEVYIDTLGNGIAIKSGDGPHIMLVAHADEPGVMIIHIDEEGFLRIIPVGQLAPNTLVGRHVQFHNHVVGVIGVESKVKVEDITYDHLYVDIAASNADEARNKVHIGLSGVILEPVVALDEHRLAGRALDNRVGCAIAMTAFNQLAKEGYHVSLALTSQQAVGARGARTVAFQLQPDLALIVDAAPAGDMPSAERMELKLGQGPAVKIMDGSAVVPMDVKDLLIESAKSIAMNIQYEVWPKGLSDAGSVQLSAAGISIGGVSYPARYVGSPTTVVDLRDAQQCVSLIVAAAKRKAGR